MNEKFPGQAYNFRQTLTGKQKFESYSDGSFDIVDGVLWFDKKRKMIGDHRPMNFAIGPVGEVDMDINFALEDYEVARGFVLCCQSYPVSDTLLIDFDREHAHS